MDVLALTLEAQPVGPLSWMTNSLVMAVLVAGALILWVRAATRHVQKVPTGSQNLLELLVETIYGAMEQVVGKQMIRRAFPLLSTLFLFILIANWSALLPGVGTIGWGYHHDNSFHVVTPLFRPPNADVNMTLAMTVVFFVLWTIWVIQEQGVWGFIVHTFGPKGGLRGLTLVMLIPLFLFVGAIEIVSIALRGVSLPIRLYGNNFAGENLLHAMGTLTDNALINALILVPFYLLELLIGGVQALVFMLLCAVYINLNTSHEEGHEHEHGHEPEHGASDAHGSSHGPGTAEAKAAH